MSVVKTKTIGMYHLLCHEGRWGTFLRRIDQNTFEKEAPREAISREKSITGNEDGKGNGCHQHGGVVRRLP